MSRVIYCFRSCLPVLVFYFGMLENSQTPVFYRGEKIAFQRGIDCQRFAFFPNGEELFLDYFFCFILIFQHRPGVNYQGLVIILKHSPEYNGISFFQQVKIMFFHGQTAFTDFVVYGFYTKCNTYL